MRLRNHPPHTVVSTRSLLLTGVFAVSLLLLALPSACGSEEPTERPRINRPTSTPPAPADRTAGNPTEERVVTTSAPTAEAGTPTRARIVTPPPAGTSAETDRAALVAFYHATGGENWTTKWESGAPVHRWHGVTTDENGRVTRLHIEKNELRGTLPPELGNLSELEFLALGDNALTGEIPPELGHLGKLEVLGLAANYLSGALPSELGDLDGLRELNLNLNELTGEIPPELGNLSNLEFLVLTRNKLTGEIPAELGSIPRLRMLRLSENQLTGVIPHRSWEVFPAWKSCSLATTG